MSKPWRTLSAISTPCHWTRYTAASEPRPSSWLGSTATLPRSTTDSFVRPRSHRRSPFAEAAMPTTSPLSLFKPSDSLLSTVQNSCPTWVDHNCAAGKQTDQRTPAYPEENNYSNGPLLGFGGNNIFRGNNNHHASCKQACRPRSRKIV